ncbi:MAG: LysR substrate-binding domain-containing protein [Methyloligellaceae bacterium]
MAKLSSYPEKINLSRTPSLTALIAFERVATFLSVIKAARSLGRSTSTVSHAINELEARFDCKLFDREGRKLSLTAAGALYLKQVREALRVLNNSGTLVSEERGEAEVRLYVSPLFANTILIPRMADFQKLFPGIELDVEIGRSRIEWSRSNIDVEIGVHMETDRELLNLDVGKIQIMPICSPAFLQGEGAIKSIKDLENVTLIHDRLRPNDWKNWLTLNGYPDLVPRHQISFNNLYSHYQAACSGLGVAFGAHPFILKWPGYGSRFEIVFPDTIAAEVPYYFTCRKDNPKIKIITEFHEWLKEVFSRKAKLHQAV